MAKEVNISKVCATINGIQNATVNVPASGNVILSVNNKTASIQLSTAAYNHRNATGNVHNDDKADIGLGKVENLSSSSIRNTLTSDNIANGLGYDLKNSIDENVTRVYGFELDCNESDPASAIRYIADNSNYRSAHMDFTNDVFDYGDWGDAWFIKNLRPVLLKFDGTVYCDLDKNDYTKDIAGNTVDISSANTIGNVMVGIPTVWIKYDISNPMKPKYYFSATKIDDTWHAYAHTNRKGEIIPYKWIGTYHGTLDENYKMRSLSNVVISYNHRNGYADENMDMQRYDCMNNYTGNDITDDNNPWDMMAYCDWMLINLLLLLIGKSTATHEIFGTGCNSYAILETGTMNTKGLFWGTHSDDTKGVKVFGIENWWGNVRKWILGISHFWSSFDTSELPHINSIFVKMTPEKINNIDYLPYPATISPSSDIDEFYELYKKSHVEYSRFADETIESSGIKWKGINFGLLPYQFGNGSNNQYFPNYVYLDRSNTDWYAIQVGDINDYMGAFVFTNRNFTDCGPEENSTLIAF